MKNQTKKIKSLGQKNNQPALRGDLYTQIRNIVLRARDRAYQSVNVIMVEAYWNVGRLIVEKEQGGKKRATYGETILADLSGRLTKEFGRGFDERNLRNMRAFYQAFPIWNALRSKSAKLQKRDSLRTELSWTHYRLLLRVENKQARGWYMRETANEHWSTRQLERQSTLFTMNACWPAKTKHPYAKKQREN